MSLVKQAVVAVLLVGGAISLTAHHGGRAQSLAEEMELVGTVTRGVLLRGPHPSMQIEVDRQRWDLQLGPLTDHAGLTESTIPVGATVRVRGHRNRDLSRLEAFIERLTWNGRTFEVALPDQ